MKSHSTMLIQFHWVMVIVSHIAIIETETVVSQCGDCGRDYRTYVPETICTLPDGGTVFYREAQTKCPLCDENSFGEFMNTDLFPELCP